MASTKKISIVVPVYNSQECMEPLAQRIDECLRESDYELILVNDGSADHSWEEIKRVASQNKNIIGVNLRKNSGQDNAIMAGLKQVRGDYVIIMDDDLQHNPADIPNLVSECAKGFDVCFANFESKKQKWWKNFGSWFNGKAAEIVIGKPKRIYLSPFKAIGRDVIDEIIKYEGPYPYVDGLLFTVTRNVPAFASGPPWRKTPTVRPPALLTARWVPSGEKARECGYRRRACSPRISAIGSTRYSGGRCARS